MKRVWMILAILALISGASYAFLNNSQEKKGTSNTTNNQNNSQQPHDPSEGGKYLVIEEWGVRFELPSDLRNDIYYETFTNSVPLEGAMFSSKILDGKVENGHCSFLPWTDGKVHGGSVENLIRRTENLRGSEFREISIINDYHYYYVVSTKPEVSCVAEDLPNYREAFSLEKSISEKLIKAFNSLEASN